MHVLDNNHELPLKMESDPGSQQDVQQKLSTRSVTRDTILSGTIGLICLYLWVRYEKSAEIELR